MSDKDKLAYYQVKLYETVDQVEPCPYCGLERVIVQIHDESYEDADEYMIEHLDEKAAVTAGCCTMYYSFGSLEKAIEKANSCASKDKRKTIRVDYEMWNAMNKLLGRLAEKDVSISIIDDEED